MKILCSPRDFAKGIESKQQMHSWTPCYLREGGKLLRSNFFLENDVISSLEWPFYPTFWRPNWSQISPDNRITLRAGRALRVISPAPVLFQNSERLYESCRYSYPRANAPLWCVSPRQGPKNWPKAHQKALFPKICSISELWKIFPPLKISPKK